MRGPAAEHDVTDRRGPFITQLIKGGSLACKNDGIVVVALREAPSTLLSFNSPAISTLLDSKIL